ncbi:hypothetical protein MZO42_07095 [Sphingomonas psychrotolerans]|uniref:Uncharacterized protein n=1 Tax=Sphingomonas psychrotolerans TaxID=1327635 RepID=A0ABU3N1M4_9SPHN|nr:hypothetical protein [Sphingomonas psychrotolerans]MDT8758458.1 hypothetical protein [Sphingomonas psychrotolerans]
MAAAPVFVQDGSLDLYWLSGAAAIAYLPSAGSDFSGQITLDQAWTDRDGVYLFFDRRPNDVAATLPALKAYLARLGPSGAIRIVWLVIADLPSAAWTSSALYFAQPSPAATSWLGQPTALPLAPYSLWIGQGATVAQAGEADGWGFSLAPASGSSFLWQSGDVEMGVTGAITIPLSGPSSGCAVFAIPVPDLATFGVGISYFYDATVETDLPPVDGIVPRMRTGDADRLALPLFAGGLSTTLTATLDPTRPLDGGRTRFALPIGGGPYLSMLASPRGHDVSLSAIAGAGTAAAGGFVFQTAPIYAAPDSSAFYLHLVPDGLFAITVTAPDEVLAADLAAAESAPPWTPAERLLCGMSGVEYAGLPIAAGCRLSFSAGHPAYAPGAGEGVPPPDDTVALTSFANGVATTAWAAVLPPSGQGGVTNYFSQPEQAPLYGMSQGTISSGSRVASPTDTPPNFLYFTELPSAQIGAGDAGTAFPLAPYRGLAPTQLDNARRIEATGIAPARREQIIPPPLGQAGTAGTPTRSVTPQGLVVDWDYANPSVWTDVVLGNDFDPVSGAANLLQLTSVHDALRLALQTNRLVLIGACPNVFATGGSVRYCPGPDDFARLIAAAPEDTVFPAVRNWYVQNHFPVSQDEAAFKATLEAIPGVTVDEAHFEALRRVAGLLRAEISGWRFQFSPWTWTSGTDATCSTGAPGTIMLLKFAPGKLADLVADPSTWAWSEVATFGGSTAAVRDVLLARIADARARRRASPLAVTPYDHFLDEVCDNPNWSGVLVLGCPIPLTELPGPLQCLAAGIDPTRFVAHHVGLNATAFQVSSGGIVLSQTSMFGLIDYQDDKELHLDPTPDAGFAYKVQSLTIEFVNSAIRGFSSRVALLPPRLFGSTVTLRDTVRGNSILMDGVFQKPPNATSDADGTYVFRIVEENLYDVSDSVLSTVAIKTAQFSTVAPADPADPQAMVQAQFRLGGALAFEELPAFDILSYGPDAAGGDPASRLEFSNLLINLSFPLYAPLTPPVFVEDADKLTVEPTSPARSQSLVNRFPVRLSTMTGVPVVGGPAPADLGYVPADTPIANSRIGAPWWGVVYEIDLGTSGALGSGSALTMTVLAAWSGKGPRDETPPLYIGVRLPGLKDLVGASLPFESFLRLGFRNIKFTAYDTDAGDRAYLMRFRRFSISALGISFPPGNMDVVLFGNPSGDKSKVGWYAAYAADADDQKQKIASPERLRLAARRGVFGRE